ncbi:class GN sortase [Nitrospira sp. NS4]|uniref:class GN sortase n=1 Tax=Nitrospira sp. NS4 TaxID=3414498 RepID=UPI003C2E883A
MRTPLAVFFNRLLVCLLAVGFWQIGEGLWIYAKAGLAQLLLQRAWSRTLAGETGLKPWPWADTWPVARLTVPALGVDQIVLNGAYGRTLAFGPGYVESSAQPGENGTTILTGHRDTHFSFLKDLQAADRLILQFADGTHKGYRVRDRRIVHATRDSIPLRDEGRQLALMTCYPFASPMSGTQWRYLVMAEGESEPVN